MRREHAVFALMLAVPTAVLAIVHFQSGWSWIWWTWLAALAAVAVMLHIVVRWHARHHRYRCQHCGNVFEITAYIDLTNPHVPGRKHLLCPGCGRRSWCEELPATHMSGV